MKPCLHCENITNHRCICGHHYCLACQQLYKSNVCPMCVRIGEIRYEQAMLHRLVPWQVVEHSAVTVKVGAL